MDNGERTFGELLTYLREKKDVTLKKLTRGNWCFSTIPKRC